MNNFPSRNEYRTWREDSTTQLFFSLFQQKRTELIQDLIDSTDENPAAVARLQGKIKIIDDFLHLKYDDLLALTEED